jgi:hypothetical protein
MRRMITDLLGCLLVLVLLLTAPAGGRHAAAMAAAPTLELCGGVQVPAHPDAGPCCLDCLVPALVTPPTVVPGDGATVAAGPMPARTAQAAAWPARRLPGTRAPPASG